LHVTAISGVFTAILNPAPLAGVGNGLSHPD